MFPLYMSLLSCDIHSFPFVPFHSEDASNLVMGSYFKNGLALHLPHPGLQLETLLLKNEKLPGYMTNPTANIEFLFCASLGNLGTKYFWGTALWSVVIWCLIPYQPK